MPYSRFKRHLADNEECAREVRRLNRKRRATIADLRAKEQAAAIWMAFGDDPPNKGKAA